MDFTFEYFDSCRLTISQPKKGHRYGPESLALAAFTDVRTGERVVDLGAGCGVIALLLAARAKPACVVAVEIQRELHAIAEQNVRGNGYASLVECVCDDLRRFAGSHPGAFEVAVANPPFFPAGGARLSPDPQRAAARHEVHGTLAELFEAARTLLVPGGRLALVIDGRRHEELESCAAGNGWQRVRREGGDEGSYVLSEWKKIETEDC